MIAVVLTVAALRRRERSQRSPYKMNVLIVPTNKGMAIAFHV